MLRDYQPPVFSDVDHEVFDALVDRDHPLRQATKIIDFLALRKLVEKYYDLDQGRPPVEPLLMIKLEFLMDRDRLSDRKVTPPADAAENAAWQRFLCDQRLLEKVLAEQAQPTAGDRTRSAVDPDVRRGRHGDF